MGSAPAGRSGASCPGPAGRYGLSLARPDLGCRHRAHDRPGFPDRGL